MFNQNLNTWGMSSPLDDAVKHADHLSPSAYMTQIQSYEIYTGKDKN